jgi:hypothetical protein
MYSPPAVDTTVAFPYMSDVETEWDLAMPQQPTIDEEGMWIWPGPEGIKKKPTKTSLTSRRVSRTEQQLRVWQR